jgi:hypothetical protein
MINRTSEESQEPAKFIFVLSQPRSGTTAFQNFIGQSSDDFVIAGELFNAVMKGRMHDILRGPFSWLTTVNSKKDRASRLEYKALLNSNAVAIMKTLKYHSRFAGRTVVIKIFAVHLKINTLATLLEEFRPDVIFLRRSFLFTFLSIKKAKNSGPGSWSHRDSSDQLVDLELEELHDYIGESDVWFDQVLSKVEELNLAKTDLSYSGIFESGEQIATLEEFLSSNRNRKIKVTTTNTKFVIQDRRKDYFLRDLVIQYMQLPQGTRTELLRLPGSISSSGLNPDRHGNSGLQ